MKLQIESTMEVICSNSSFIDIAVVHNNAMITKKTFAKYPKTFLGTLGYFTSTILLLVALLPHSGKLIFLYQILISFCNQCSSKFLIASSCSIMDIDWGEIFLILLTSCFLNGGKLYAGRFMETFQKLIHNPLFYHISYFLIKV